jgi:two-component system response regulator DegU
MKTATKIVIADDHPLFLYGVKQLLESIENVVIAAEFNSGGEVFSFIEKEKPDIALLDIRMPECTGLEIAEKISSSGIETKVVLLTMFKNLNYFYKAVSFGVKGYLLKDRAVTELYSALNKIISGDVFISPELQEMVLKKKLGYKSEQALLNSLNSLTKAERNILKLLSQWKSTKEIADKLFISERTVSNHRNHISDKLNLKGTNHLVRFAIENKELF